MNKDEWAPGIPKSPHSQAISSWTLPPAIVDRMEKYYLLQWDSAYFWEQYKEGRGIILHQGFSYSVVFFRGRIPAQNGVVYLSFRKQINFPMGYVLISQKWAAQK